MFSSQGVKPSKFANLDNVVLPGTTDNLDETCTPELDAAFLFHRKVEPRHTLTTINAAFNFRNFWDGRANNRFNGFDPFGSRSPAGFVLKKHSNAMGVVAKKTQAGKCQSGIAGCRAALVGIRNVVCGQDLS